MKERHSITINPDIWQSAENRYGKGNISDNIERLLADDLNTDTPTTLDPIHILQRSDLTDKMKRTVRTLINEKKTDIPIPEFTTFVEQEGIYDRQDFKRKAVERIDKDPYSMYEMNGSSLKMQQVECRCGATIYPHALEDGYKCPQCGVEVLKPAEPDGFRVVSDD